MLSSSSDSSLFQDFPLFFNKRTSKSRLRNLEECGRNEYSSTSKSTTNSSKRPVSLVDLAGSYVSNPDSRDFFDFQLTEDQEENLIKQERNDVVAMSEGDSTDDEEDDGERMVHVEEVESHNIISQFVDIEENRYLENASRRNGQGNGSVTSRESQGSVDVDELMFGDIEL